MKEGNRKAAEENGEHINQEAYEHLLQHSVLLNPDFKLPEIKSDAGSSEKPALPQKQEQVAEKGSRERSGNDSLTKTSCFDMVMPIEKESSTGYIRKVKKELDTYMARVVTSSRPRKNRDKLIEPKLQVKSVRDGAGTPGLKQSLSSIQITARKTKAEAKRLAFSEPVKSHKRASKLMVDKKLKPLDHKKKMALNCRPDSFLGDLKIENMRKDIACSSRHEWSFGQSMKEGVLDRGNHL